MKKQFVRSASIAVFGLALTMASSAQSATFDYIGSMTDASLGGTSTFSMSLTSNGGSVIIGDISSLLLTFDTDWNTAATPGEDVYKLDEVGINPSGITLSVDGTSGALSGSIIFDFSSSQTDCIDTGYNSCRVLANSTLTFGAGSAMSFAGTEARNANLGGTHSRAMDFTGSLDAEVPVPAAVWLFGSGLLGLIGVARRKKA